MSITNIEFIIQLRTKCDKFLRKKITLIRELKNIYITTSVIDVCKDYVVLL